MKNCSLIKLESSKMLIDSSNSFTGNISDYLKVNELLQKRDRNNLIDLKNTFNNIESHMKP